LVTTVCLLGSFASSCHSAQWMQSRPDLKIRTRELYAWLLEKYVVPQIGHVPLAKITPTNGAELARRPGPYAKPTPTRQAYSLLRVMLDTAVTDELLQRNPCTDRQDASVVRPSD